MIEPSDSQQKPQQQPAAVEAETTAKPQEREKKHATKLASFNVPNTFTYAYTPLCAAL